MHIKIEDKMIKIFVLPLIEITIIINKKITSKMITNKNGGKNEDTRNSAVNWNRLI